MFFDERKAKNDEIVLYVPGRWSAFLLTGVIFIIVLPWFVQDVSYLQSTISEQMSNPDFVEIFRDMRSTFIILLFLLIPSLWAIYLFYTKLIIRPDGLIWIKGGISTLHVSWDTVHSFQTHYFSNRGGPGGGGGGRFLRVAFKLKLGVTPESKGSLARLLYGRATDIIPLSIYTYVPADYYRGTGKINKTAFKQTRVGAKLYQYAPHLFEETTVS